MYTHTQIPEIRTRQIYQSIYRVKSTLSRGEPGQRCDPLVQLG